MKTILFSLALVFAPLAQSSDAIDEAKYEVPAPEELEDFAKFKVKINQAYTGADSETISYTFPEELTGTPALTVTLKRVPGTENSWEGREMTAECFEDSDLFTCEMFLIKKPVAQPGATVVDIGSVFSGNMVMKSAAAPEFETFIDKDNVVNFLNTNAVALALPPNHLKNQLFILDKFLSNEPAGILSYKFSPYGK